MTRQLYTCHATLTVIALLLVGLARAATTIHVPADQPTIQAAISAAQNGDTILVSPGTYAENIDFIGKAITVKSTNGAKVTIIDAHQVGPAATFKRFRTQWIYANEWRRLRPTILHLRRWSRYLLRFPDYHPQHDYEQFG